MRSPLAGRTVLVTGAARGIGAETARRAAERGARLALLGLEPEGLEKVAAELGDGHVWHECDVTDQDGLDQAVAATVDALGRIDVVVANAGIANLGTVAVSPVQALTRTVDVNLNGVIRTVAATLPHVSRERGYYLLVSSAAAFTVLPGMAAYCAAKAGVEQVGNALRLELAHRGVSVGTAHPAWIDTDMVRDFSDDLPAFRERLATLPWPLNATTSVEDCAAAFVDGMERRRRKIYVPRAIAGVHALRTLVLGPVGQAIMRREVRAAVPELERDVTALGRSFGARSSGFGERS
jgi:hypothetical protein